jgi:hypothetical protein
LQNVRSVAQRSIAFEETAITGIQNRSDWRFNVEAIDQRRMQQAVSQRDITR